MLSLSNIAGTLSIFCWIVVFTPQMWKNYKNKSGEGLSLDFLWIWLIGDFFNILGIITMNDFLYTMLFLALYYTLADIVLIIQVYYYQYSNDFQNEEQRPLFSNENSPLMMTTNQLSLVFIVSLVTIISISGLYFFVSLQTFSLIIGWISAVLYVFSRIPQIRKNFLNRSVDGLSLYMFLIGITGNVLFCASILLKSMDRDYIIQVLPWLFGSFGTIMLDVLIGIQFYVYEMKY